MSNIFEEHESEVRSYCRKYPVVFSKAKNAEMFDEDGGRYIDFLSVAGSMNYGHNNPVIKGAIQEYLAEDHIINSLDMYTEAKRDFIDTLYNRILAPRGLDYKIMCCGATGTNAVEAALKLARKNTKRRNVIAFGGAFHGMTLGSLAVTTDRISREGAGVSLDDVTFAPYDGTEGVNALSYLKWIIDDDHSGVDKPAAIILETIQAEGGINIASDEWLRGIRKYCSENGILLIVDDIQVGIGRSGWFFSFERAGIVPDMVVLSKSISGFGMPMSLLLMKPELDIFRPAEHNGTFRGNNLAFVGGAAALKYFEDNKLDQVSRANGLIIENAIKDICAKYDNLEYRGTGMIWGIDFSRIDPTYAIKCVHEAFNNHLILEVAGRKDAVLKIMPPLTIEEDTLKEGLEIVAKTVAKVMGK
ncbi:MAG TPA: diaminobutyrate--2-oxoglutarate transaminase [Lachnospiraceae bacterium]|nr:diaminobutyrate--2-oxoglutarate transaminase [Eubacterium sp.]HBZ03875.1 diaminobutyrate--2-oxoglutarate transaminase [Lachnospiraceae bacterium]